MEKQQLKTLIAAGDYRPEPAEVAQAMLRRRAVRDLLVGTPGSHNGNGSLAGQASTNGNGQLPLNRADRIQSPSAAPRQAA
jgi:hypothetical protein